MKKYMPDSLRNYKPIATYSSARNMVLDIIIKRGYARYQAEAMLDALWKLYEKDTKKLAEIISQLPGFNGNQIKKEDNQNGRKQKSNNHK